MKKVKRWRYDCDFCKKTGGSAFHMKNHEEICTANPDRKCGFCRIMEQDQTDLVELGKIITRNIVKVRETDFGGKEYDWNCWPEISTETNDESELRVLNELREKAGNCPACILAAIKQTNTVFLFRSFDFKKEKTAMFNECQPTDPEYYY